LQYQEVLTFWFKDTPPELRFAKNLEFDRLLTAKFGHALEQAAHGELAHWRQCIHGRLAEIILLDQFSRNIYRDSPKAFAQDPMALVLSQEALPFTQGLNTLERAFLYMPFMHSESKRIHETALKLFSEPGLEEQLKYEILHKKIIDQFGRYPHRNAILGRSSSPEEIALLKEPNSAF
jgi:uncharacterized protein (DUF924 family)